MRMLGVYPVRFQSGIRIKNFAAGNTLLIYQHMCRLRRAVDEKGEGKGAYKDKQAENNIAQDDGSDSQRERDDADRPEPVRAPLLMLVFMSVPFEFKGLPWHRYENCSIISAIGGLAEWLLHRS